MALDALVDSTQLDSDLTSVANAIRTKGGTSSQLAFPADFVSAIAAIPTGGGSSVKSGTYTPATNTVGPSFDIGADLDHFVVYATASPNESIKWFKAAICDFSKESDTHIITVASNNTGSSMAGGAIFGINWFSKNGNTITCTNTGTSGGTNAGYWIGGITYQWYAW